MKLTSYLNTTIIVSWSNGWVSQVYQSIDGSPK